MKATEAVEVVLRLKQRNRALIMAHRGHDPVMMAKAREIEPDLKRVLPDDADPTDWELGIVEEVEPLDIGTPHGRIFKPVGRTFRIPIIGMELAIPPDVRKTDVQHLPEVRKNDTVDRTDYGLIITYEAGDGPALRVAVKLMEEQ